MSLWYDKKGKSYASKGSSSWIRYYAEHIVKVLKEELMAKFTRHYDALEGVHRAKDILYDDSTSVKTAIDNVKRAADDQDTALNAALSAEAAAREAGLAAKVDKVSGKALSSNDYTDAEKEKLAAIAPGAQVNTVTAVAGKTGAVTLSKADVGLGNADNTADRDKPISTAAQAALNQKADLSDGKVKAAQLPYFNTSYTLTIDGTPIYGCRFADVSEDGTMTLNADGSGDWLISVTEDEQIVLTKVVQTDEIAKKADLSAVLTKTNETAFTPTEHYQPATKKYVDDVVSEAGGGDMMKTVYDQNGDGIVDNAEKLGGQLPSYYAAAAALTERAPLLHSSSGTNFGAGTKTLYGHCRTVDDLLQTEYADGLSLSAHQGAVLDGKIAALKAGYLTPPALTAATPRGTKIGTSGWTGTGFFCTDTNVLYKTEDNTLPNYNSYTRFCLRPADLSSRSYLNWTPYYTSGSTEIEFVWSPARGLYEALVPIKDGTAEAYISTYITWKYHPPVQIRYGKATNYFNAYDPAGESHDGYTNFTIAKRPKHNIRDFSGMLTKYDYDILTCYSANWNVFENLYDDLTETERSMLILAWDVTGEGSVPGVDALHIAKRVINQIKTPLPIEIIDNFSN